MTIRPSDVRDEVLLEREHELAQIDAALEAARASTGAMVLVEGAAGIGKTSLLRVTRQRAAELGIAVVSARGSELEGELAFGVVRQLFEPAILRAANAAGGGVLAGAAALAAPIFAAEVGAHSGAGMAEQRFAMLHGLYWLCANLAEERPLLVSLDDAHWADVDSLRFVAYLANRLEGLPLAVVIAARPAETPAEEDVLGALAADSGAVALGPAPLSEAAVGALLEARLGEQPDSPFVAACHAATGGTPLLVRELIRELRTRGVAPAAASADEIAEMGPPTIARTVVRRVRRLGAGALELARATAVLGSDAEPRRAARVAGLQESSAARSLDALEAVGVMVAGRPIEFVHPIVRSAVYGEIPAGERSRLHALAAQLLAADGVAEERVASHVLSTTPSGDPLAVELLVRAARAAFARGAPSSAAAHLERALAEPPSGELLVDVLHELGRAEAALGVGTFAGRLRQAIEVCGDVERRARIALDLGGALAHAGAMSAAASTYEAALDELPDPGSRLAMRLEGELLPVALYHHPSRGSVGARLAARVAQLEAGLLDDPALLAALGRWLCECRPPARRGVEVAERAASEQLVVGTWVPGGVCGALAYAGRFGRTAAYLEQPLSYARSQGWRLSVAWGETWQAAVSLMQGEVARAEAEAREALDAMLDPAVAGVHTALAWARAVLIEALLARGAVEEAAAVLDSAGSLEEYPPTYWRSVLIGARGRLSLAQGDAEGALADAFASAPPYGDRVNPAVRPWRSDAAWALRLLGRSSEGRDHAEAELRDAREFEVPHAVGAALRAVAACSPGDDAVGILREAVEVLERSEARLELASALVDLGAVLRRGKRRVECQEPLRRALDLAHRCGATALAERARMELLATGARPRRAVLSGAESLTASERRVAELAAGGMTNREIAQTLFVTQRTVETHMTQVLRKLEVSSRVEIGSRLRADTTA